MDIKCKPLECSQGVKVCNCSRDLPNISIFVRVGGRNDKLIFILDPVEVVLPENGGAVTVSPIPSHLLSRPMLEYM